MTPDEPPPLPEATPGGEGRPERWRVIPGHRGYEASSLGRVRSVARTLRDGRAAGGVVLKPQRDKDGYLTVLLGRKRVRVNVAVALAFHGRPEVMHLNDVRDDNRPGNLAWGSHWLNMRRMGREGRKGDGSGSGKELPFWIGTPGTGDQP